MKNILLLNMRDETSHYIYMYIYIAEKVFSTVKSNCFQLMLSFYRILIFLLLYISFQDPVTTVLNGVIFFEWGVTLRELFVKFHNRDTIIMYRIHINSNRISHLYCKNVQIVHLQLQNVQKMLHRLGTVVGSIILAWHTIVSCLLDSKNKNWFHLYRNLI